MSEETIIIDTPEGIQFARLCSLKAGLKLEIKGMHRSAGRRSCYAILKDLGYKGSREKVLEAVQADVDKAIHEKHRKSIEPAWGVKSAIPDNAKGTWGARAIYKKRGAFIDIPNDRQGFAGDPEWTHKMLPALQELMSSGLINDLAKKHCPPSVNRGVTMKHDKVTVYMNTFGSRGYLYLSAWITE